jgi:hypothetical protein
VHKLVCGPGKARPFRHPTLNDAELEILRNPACQEELNSMAKHFIQGEVLMMSRTGFLEWMVGAPKGSLLQVTCL